MTETAHESEKLLKFNEALEYVSDKGFPCTSRSKFYDVIEDFKVPYIDANPRGKYRVRLFRREDLDAFLEKALNTDHTSA